MRKLGIAIIIVGVIVSGGFFYLNQLTGGIIGFSVSRAILGNGGSPTRVQINGIGLYYETYSAGSAGSAGGTGGTGGAGGAGGAGDPVLILHGDFAYLETMHNQIRALSKSYLVIAPDSRAHGRTTDQQSVALSYSLMADDMVALLDELDIEKVNIFGWSGGGNVGMDMAIRYPDRVSRLATYGANFSTDWGGESFIAGLTPDNPNLAPYRSTYEKISPNPDRWPVFVGKMKTMWQTYPTFTTDDLATINVPVLIMAGEFDMIPLAHTQEMAASIPGATLVILEGQDHFAPLMAHETVNSHVAAFFE